MRDGQEDDITGDKQDIGGNCEFMYIHRLLIDKDLHECRSISINFLCALYISFIQRPIHFLLRLIHFYSFLCYIRKIRNEETKHDMKCG